MIQPTAIQLKSCLGLLAGLYAVAGTFGLYRRQAGAFAVFALGFLLNAALIVFNWLAAGEPPLGNMYHVLTFLPLTFFPLYVFLRWGQGPASSSAPGEGPLTPSRSDWVLPYFAFAAMLPLIGTIFMDSGHEWRRIPALQSHWFVPHVVSYMISYALMAVAFIISLVALKRRRTQPWEEGEAAVYQICRLSMPFMTFGLLVGAIWAEEAWGAYWSWDPKETWALITWTGYLMYFHAIRCPQWRRRALALQVLAFVALVITFLVVNLLPKFGGGLHSYAN